MFRTIVIVDGGDGPRWIELSVRNGRKGEREWERKRETRGSESARDGRPGVGEAARGGSSRSDRASTVQSSVLRRTSDITAGRALGVVIRARRRDEDDDFVLKSTCSG